MHRSVLENDDFVAWANDNIIVIVGHSDKGHDPLPITDKQKTSCPLYQGLNCEQHQQAAIDLQNPPEGLPKVPSESGVPNSWMIAPNGEVRKIETPDQNASKIMELVDEWQKALGPRLTLKSFEKYQAALAAADVAVAKSDWRGALKSMAIVEKGLKKAPESLSKTYDEHMRAIEKAIDEAWQRIRDGDGDVASKQVAAKKLLSQLTTSTPAKKEIEAWLKQAAKPK